MLDAVTEAIVELGSLRDELEALIVADATALHTPQVPAGSRLTYGRQRIV
jgi:hypothetical protein